MPFKRLNSASFCALFALALCGCGTEAPLCAPPAVGDSVYVVEHGWHAELGLPVDELGPDLAFYRAIFPDARAIIFGYGKQTFFTAPPQTVSEYILGPFPGPAVIQVIGLNVMPDQAYGKHDTIKLALPPGGRQALSEFIANDLAKDTQGKAIIVAPSTDPAGLFYAAVSDYNLLHTCNTWTADALHSAGLPVDSDGVIFSGQVMGQIHAAASHCQLAKSN